MMVKDLTAVIGLGEHSPGPEAVAAFPFG